MSVLFFNETKRMAVIKLTGSAELIVSRSKADGSTVGIKAVGMQYPASFKTLDVAELLDALSYVTRSDDQLIADGLPEEQVKPRRKRDRKAERERREIKRARQQKEDEDLKKLFEDF